MIGLNSGRLCFLFLCSVSSLIYLVLNPYLQNGDGRVQYATRFQHLRSAHVQEFIHQRNAEAKEYTHDDLSTDETSLMVDDSSEIDEEESSWIENYQDCPYMDENIEPKTEHNQVTVENIFVDDEGLQKALIAPKNTKEQDSQLSEKEGSLLWFPTSPVTLDDEDPQWITNSPVTQEYKVPAWIANSYKRHVDLAYLQDVCTYNKSLQWENCYKPVACASSIQNRMISIFSTENRIRRYLPMILDYNSLKPDIYKRLQEFKVPFGWKNLTYEEVENFVSSYDRPDSSCLLIPFEERYKVRGRERCYSCAVVGNGGILRGAKQGRTIDKHDFVFRTNLAVTKGFEDDVGTRTSVYVFSLQTLRGSLVKASKWGLKFTSAPADEGITYLAFGTEPNDYTYFTSEITGKDVPIYFVKKDIHKKIHDYRKPNYFSKKLTDRNLKMFHPDFMRYVGWSWIQSHRRHIRTLGAGYRPTTGAYAVMAALHSCDKVDLYGFSSHPQNYTEYYFNKKYIPHKNYMNHDQRTEAELWDLLDRTNVISLYKRPKYKKDPWGNKQRLRYEKQVKIVNQSERAKRYFRNKGKYMNMFGRSWQRN